MARRGRSWITIAVVVGALVVGACVAAFALLHVTAGVHVVVRNTSDAPLCDVSLDPRVGGREVTTIERLAPHDTVGASVAVGALDWGGIAVRYRACDGETWIEATGVDPARAITLDGRGVRPGVSVQREEEE